MRNLFVLVALVLGMAFSAFSQNNISISFTSVNGKIVFNTDRSYTTNFTISGLNNDNDLQNFKTPIIANQNVKSFNAVKASPESADYKATMVLLNNEKEAMTKLFNSIPCNHIIVDGKTYTKDQMEQIKADLKAKKEISDKEKMLNKK